MLRESKGRPGRWGGVKIAGIYKKGDQEFLYKAFE